MFHSPQHQIPHLGQPGRNVSPWPLTPGDCHPQFPPRDPVSHSAPYTPVTAIRRVDAVMSTIRPVRVPGVNTVPRVSTLFIREWCNILLSHYSPNAFLSALVSFFNAAAATRFRLCSACSSFSRSLSARWCSSHQSANCRAILLYGLYTMLRRSVASILPMRLHRSGTKSNVQ